MVDDSATYELHREFESKSHGIGKGKYGRILNMAHTPNNEEYTKTLYITGLGILVIGAVGFFVWWLMTYIPLHP